MTGEWLIGEEKKTFKGNLDIAEFSFGELDDLQVIFSHHASLFGYFNDDNKALFLFFPH